MKEKSSGSLIAMCYCIASGRKIGGKINEG